VSKPPPKADKDESTPQRGLGAHEPSRALRGARIAGPRPLKDEPKKRDISADTKRHS